MASKLAKLGLGKERRELTSHPNDPKGTHYTTSRPNVNR
jgi:hypothetical protein